MPLCERGVIVGDDRPLQLAPEGMGRREFRFHERLGKRAALRGQRVARPDIGAADCALACHEIAYRLRRDISGGPVADAVTAIKLHAGRRQNTQIAIAEAQVGAAVIVYLGDEMGVASGALQEVTASRPRLLRTGVRRDAAQPHLRQCLVGILLEHASRRRVGGNGLAMRQRRLLQNGAESFRNTAHLHHTAVARAFTHLFLYAYRTQFLVDRRAVIDQDDIAAGDAHVVHTAAIGRGQTRRQAQGERQRIFWRPLDFDDQRLQQSIYRAMIDPGEPHRVPVRRICIRGVACRRPFHFLENEHVADLQVLEHALRLSCSPATACGRRLIEQRRTGRAARQTAFRVAPGVELDLAVSLENRYVRRTGIENRFVNLVAMRGQRM